MQNLGYGTAGKFMGARYFGRIRADRLLTYLFVIFAIYFSGSVYLTSYYYKESILIWLVVTMGLIIYRTIRIKADLLGCAIFSIVFVFVTMVVRKDYVNAYFSTFTFMTLTVVWVGIIDSKIYEEIYQNIIVVLAALSFIMFAVEIVLPNFYLLFPYTEGFSSVHYYNAGIYVYNYSKTEFIVEHRNNSIFWEPGVAQVFFNLGIFIELKKMYANEHYSMLKIILLMIAVLTTGSFTGYFLLLLLFTAWLWRQNRALVFFEILVIPIFIAILIILTRGTTFGNRIHYYLSSLDEIYIRMGFDLVIDMLNEGKLFQTIGMGITNFEGTGYLAVGSLPYYPVVFGLAFSSVWLYIYYRYIRALPHGVKFLAAIMFICIGMTESLLQRPVFLLFGLCAIKGGTSKNEEGNNNQLGCGCVQYRKDN